MSFRRTLTLVIALLVGSALFTYLTNTGQAQGGPATSFYDLDVIAVSGQNNLMTLFTAPSINGKGVVSFAGRTTGGGFNVFLSDAPGAYHSLNPGGTNRAISGNTQISTSNQIVALESIIGLGQQELRVWDGNTLNTSTPVAGSSTAFNDFAAILPNPSMNNTLQPAFSAQAKTTFTHQLVTGTRTTAFNTTNIPLTFKPMIADDGQVVVRAGNTITSPIVLYQFNLIGSVTIASSPNFSQLGDGPGISDDGKVVVFFGNLSASGALSLGLTPGPGIFASVDEGGPNRRVLRLSGRTRELGSDAAGNPIGFDPASYSAFNRVTVTNQELGPLGIDGDSFTVCFQATPTAPSPNGLFTANNGLWTARTDVRLQGGSLTYRTLGPIPVAQIGTVIDGKTVTDIIVNDAIANATTDTINGNARIIRRGECRVAFSAFTNAGDILVRGTYFDSDEDALPDHWETQGVYFGMGVVDLPAMGASPMHKDIFVHIDYMEPNAGVSFKPKAAALNAVITAFRQAPVNNPDGTIGINIHIDAGPDSIMDPRNNRKWRARSLSTTVPFQSPIMLWNGATWHFADLYNIKAAFFGFTGRAPIFHYALFGSQFGGPLDPGGGTFTGVSPSIPDSDFFVALGSMVPAGGTTLQQAGTFMHELGHNLGLFHGGNENTQLKPNYLSIMNYSFQLTGLIKANRKLHMDYSRDALPTLSEAMLNENLGIQDPGNHRTIWSDQNLIRRLSGTPPVVDWFFNGVRDNPMPSVNVNRDAGIGNLTGFKDWDAIIFDGGGKIGTGATGDTGVEPGTVHEEFNESDLRNLIPADLTLQCEIEEDVVVTPEGAGNAPFAVTFDASASTAPCAAIVSYSWDFGDKSTGSGAIVTHTYTTPGTYTASVIITDANGNINSLETDYIVVVNASGTCAYSISPQSVFFTASGGDSDFVSVSAPPGCNWTAVSNVSWIDVLAGSPGSGNGTVSYVVRENFTGSARTGTMTVAGHTFTVIQNSTATCSYSISPINTVIGAAGGSGSVNITTSTICAWQAVTNVPWITVTSGNIGVGSGRTTFSVAPNPGPKGRDGLITIGGQNFAIKQTFP